MSLMRFFEEETTKDQSLGEFIVEHINPNSTHLFGYHLPHFQLPSELSFLSNYTQDGVAHFQITAHMVMMVISAIVLITLLRMVYSKGKLTRFGHLIEILVLFVRDEIVIPNIDEKRGRALTPFFATLFFFILIMNLLSLIPGAATSTANINVTATFAVSVMIVMHAQAIKNLGFKKYMHHFTADTPAMIWAIMVPIEILSNFFIKPFALAIRLFANMTAGHIVIFALLGLIGTLKTFLVAPVSILMVLFVFMLECLVAFLQAYIFVMLSSLFVGMLSHDAHAHDHDHNKQSQH